MYEYQATLNRVIDGDTVDLNVDLGFGITQKTRFRLADIDAPEVRTKDAEEKAAGNRATEWLKSVFDDPRNSTVLIITTKKKGKYGRYLCEIFACHGPRDMLQSINKLMVNQGHAKFKDY